MSRDVLKSGASAFLVDKGNYRHFMAKEIHEQPEVVGHTLARYVDMATERVSLPIKLPFDFNKHPAHLDHGLRHGVLCRLCREILVRAVRAPAGRGRRRLRIPLPRGAACARAISRSSSRSRARPPTRWPRCATPRRRGEHTLSVVNVPTSTIARESDGRAADARRSRDRRRLDQGVHLPAHGRWRCACDRGRPGTRQIVRRRRGASWCGADRGAAADGRGARDRAADREARARARAKAATCSISAAAPSSRSRSRAR